MSQNGQLADSELYPTQIRRGGRLTKAAALSADRMALAFALDRDQWLQATDTYRTLDEQWALYNGPKRHLAAYPGTSNHGWARAVDFASGINVRSSAAHRWMQANAWRYGWDNPNWATPGAPGFQKDEPWHWEYDASRDRKRRAHRVRTELRRGEIGVGASGEKVRVIQRDLNRHLRPENRVVVDGDYGFATAVAVVKFQSSRRFLNVNGVAGPFTRARLAKGRKR